MRMPDSIEVQGGPITLVFSKSGRAFFSERITGNVWEVVGDRQILVKHLPVINFTGHHETGVIGIALDPDFEKNGLIYAFYTEGKTLAKASNKVVRFTAAGGDVQTLIDDIPAGQIHNGGIIAFGPDQKLYIGVGISNSVQEKSQDKNFLAGKTLRINPDGSIPNDNPFKNSPVYSLGHRNIFGLAFQPKTGKLYICEEGPDTDDEINIIEPGGNYGWPVVAGFSSKAEFINPIQIWTPTITPTQSFFQGNALYFSSFNDGTVHRLTLTSDGSRAVSDDVVYRGRPFGLVGVFSSPTGEYFVATTNKIEKVKFSKGEKMKKSSIMWIIAAVIVVALTIGAIIVTSNSGSNNGSNGSQTIATNSVSIQSFSFSPSSISVKKGDTVTWTNHDSTTHTVVADDASFDVVNVAAGGTASHTFEALGKIKYHCSIHPSMTGTVTVQ